ncbi:MAG TPA: cyclopropane-fatty-acyl-phospholipid synthase family protein, partial [Candidatus Binatia bacterium]
MTRRANDIPEWLAELASARGFSVRTRRGSRIGSDAAPFAIVLGDASSALALGQPSSALSVGRAWIGGSFDIEGDLFEAMRVMQDMAPQVPVAFLRVLGFLRRLGRPLRSATRDISSHYDLPTAFYELFLDPMRVYTCAYWRQESDTLEQAQRAKLDLVCRKLRLGDGDRLLDLGCGWGGLAIWAAANYGARVHAVTLSAAQAARAAQSVREAGLHDRVRVECLDHRQVATGQRFERIAAVGMIEHVGRHGYAALFARVRDWLEPDGLFLNHGITMRRGSAWSSQMEFLHHHVFPGLDLVDLSTTLASIEESGLEVLDVENLRPHYARTTREWAQRLWQRRDEAVAIAGEKTWRIFVAYLAAASVAFTEGWIGLHQVVARRASAR